MFSIKRFSEQFKILIYQTITRHGLYLLIYALYLIFNIFMDSKGDPFKNFGFILCIVSLAFSIDVFGKLRISTGSGITYFMTPATIFEKYLAAWLHSTLVPFLTLLLTYLIIHSLSVTTGNIFSPGDYSYSFPDIHKIIKVLGDMFFIQSLYFFGSVLFRKNPFGKTSAVIIGFIVLVIIISGLIFKNSLEGAGQVFNNNFNFNLNGSMDGYTINGIPMRDFFEGVKKVIVVFSYILPVACWTAAYFRLKNLEI